MMARLPRRIAALAFPLLLAACAAIPPQSANQPASQIAARRFQPTIDLGGRLSVRYQGEYREEALHGGFTWSQTPSSVNVMLLSPLGQTLAVIDETPDGATLTQAGQPARHAPDVDSLTIRTLGWPLPVSGLRDWLQGFATDTAGRRFIATPHTPDVTTNDGWRIHYANWEDDGTTSDHPRRIDLERFTRQAGAVSLRIVIDTWQAR